MLNADPKLLDDVVVIDYKLVVFIAEGREGGQSWLNRSPEANDHSYQYTESP